MLWKRLPPPGKEARAWIPLVDVLGSGMLERVAEPLWELGSPGIPEDFLLKVLRRLYLGPWSSSIIPPLSLHASDWVRWLASCSGRSGVKVPYSVLQIIPSLLIVYIFLGALGTSHSSPAAL